uniref:Class I hydrophobin hgfI n=1 Tax=Grifola frondosa TaxID=5627 RepID=HGF1_GRIFR|nr:HGFI [Grifola frondosa]ABO42329.1 hydrophobin [Grifola frondosa]
MFSKLAIFATAAFAVLAAATPVRRQQCTTGQLQCCESTSTANDPATSELLGLIGVVISDVDALVGLTCSPISVIGVGSGSACTANPVCCDSSPIGGLVSIGCVPVNV